MFEVDFQTSSTWIVVLDVLPESVTPTNQRRCTIPDAER